MGRTLYLECESGISGDMSVAALLDLGADEAVLRRALCSLNIDGLCIEVTKVSKSGLCCTDFRVTTGSPDDGRDHDMNYLYGHVHGHAEHAHEEHDHGEHGGSHGHGHAEHAHEEHGHAEHAHRGISDIKRIIDGAELTDNARRLALKIFDILAKAEAKAHGIAVCEVHFHEVGAADSIADIVGFAVCYDNLGIDRTVITDIAEGSGTVRCQHGILPVPVPAVVNIAAEYGLNFKKTGVCGELVTPTGAAIAAAVMTEQVLPDRYTVKASGLGAGKRKYELPGFVRAMILESSDCPPSLTAEKSSGGSGETDEIYRLESDIDDCSGETLGYAQELLYEAGAREVHYTPVFMKKNRPAYELVVICDGAHIEALERIIFGQTTTIGIRRVRMERTVLKRETVSVKTSLGEARVKVCTFIGGKIFYPEYEDVAAICRVRGMKYQDVYELIRRECYDGI